MKILRTAWSMFTTAFRRTGRGNNEAKLVLPPADSILLRTPQRKAAFAFIDSFPWAEVHHAFGPATDAPRELRRMISDDEDERMNAICRFLFGAASHQYTLYPATPFVMLSVLQLLELPDLPGLKGGAEGPGDLLAFLRTCVERGQAGIDGPPHPAAATIEQVSMKCEEAARRFLSHPVPEISSEAKQLLRARVHT